MSIRVVVKLSCNAPGCRAECLGTAHANFTPFFGGWSTVVVDEKANAGWRRADDFGDELLCPAHVPEFEACVALGVALRRQP
jgi:hypothetical protein